jgi:hypothetical protein
MRLEITFWLFTLFAETLPADASYPRNLALMKMQRCAGASIICR